MLMQIFREIGTRIFLRQIPAPPSPEAAGLFHMPIAQSYGVPNSKHK